MSFLGDSLPQNREMRRALQRATKGGVVLRRAGTGVKVRNVETGRVIPCSWDDCMKDGDDTIRIMVDHEQPRWRDPVTGEQEKLIYIFCSDLHKGFYRAAFERSLAER
jgi:hypothetical protein